MSILIYFSKNIYYESYLHDYSCKRASSKWHLEIILALLNVAPLVNQACQQIFIFCMEIILQPQ